MGTKIKDNRELSWLKFNKRVLEESLDEKMPTLERLTFCSIFSSNLDEFFMVRVGSLHDQILVGDTSRENKTNMTATEQIDAILKRVSKLIVEKDNSYQKIMHALNKEGISQINFKDLTKQQIEFFEYYFEREILPLVSPQVIDKRHPFPFLNNKDIYVIAKIEAKSGVKLGIVKASGVFDRVIFMPGETTRFMLVEDLILHFASRIFGNFKIGEKSLIRVTRNADINAEEGLVDLDLDFRLVMTELLKKRKKLCPVRLEISRNLSDSTLKELCSRLELSEKSVFLTKSPLDMSYVFSLQDKLSARKDLFFNKIEPQKSAFLTTESMIKQIQRKDILLSYPYESIKPFIKLLFEAAEDKNVISIKITLYRVAKDSKIIDALIEAAENGKEVLVLVELRARFDEENNIGWSKQLEDAGCRVMYGPQNYKVHSKLLLITRKIGNKVEYITQIGTGNYNEKTARLYTDLSLMTANKSIALEATTVFNALSLGNFVTNTNYLMVAPLCLQSKIIELLDKEIEHAKSGEKAYFGGKFNSLSDKTIINKLIEASQVGVKIELIVRGVCCLIAGVEGYTENITIISIVGRFLEHSRIYIFGADERQSVYISSADFMTRNTLRRVEVAVPILDVTIKSRILTMFSVMLSDNVKARIQQNDGSYIKKVDDNPTSLDSQMFFTRQAYQSAQAYDLNSDKKKSIFSILKKIKRSKN